MSRRVVLAAALVSADRRVLASCLAWPEFDRLFREGGVSYAPLIRGIHHG